MNVWSFVAGPLLWLTFFIVSIGILARIAFFSYAIVKSSKHREFRWSYLFVILGRFLLPFHKAATKRPLYATIRYLFHACLIAAPLWASGHITLFQLSRFGWYWSPLPDVWTDRITLLVLVFVVLFLFRRLIIPGIRRPTSKSDSLLILIVALPFLSGYLAYHQWFPYEPMMIVHVLSGEAMLISIVLLFCRTKLDAITCTGCAACELCCPTATLESIDKEKFRTFTYSHYQCIACGACVQTCPEGAASLKHEMSLKKLFPMIPREEIRSVELNVCERCGCCFAPAPQLERVEQMVAEGEREIPVLQYCDKCKRRFILDQISVKSANHTAPLSQSVIRIKQ